MNISIKFIKEVFQILHNRLAMLDFEKRKSGILTIKITDDVIGWIGLNKATRGQRGFLEINPVLGVRNQQIEKLVAELTREKFDEFVPPTLSGNIGYMTPANKFRPYLFSENGTVEPIVEELVNDVCEYGLPFIRAHSDMVALVEGMCECRFAVKFMVAYRIPVSFFLLGRMDAASDCLNAELVKLGDQKDPATLRFKAFAADLAKRIENAKTNARKEDTIS